MTAPNVEDDADYNPFEDWKLTNPLDIKRAHDRKDPNDEYNYFDEYEYNEGWGKWALRTLSQIPQGIAQAATWPIDVFQQIGIGDALNQEDIDHLRMVSEMYNIPFDEDAYYSAVQSAANSVPTVRNIADLIDEKTGLPLTPKTTGQKLLNLGSTAGKFAPGNLTQKVGGGATAAATSGVLQAGGAPELLADFAGLGVSHAGAKATPPVSIGAETKPSGLPVRRFESTTSPTKVSAERKDIIKGKVEQDFRQITDKITSESPIGKTVSELRENPSYKSNVKEQFTQVEKLSEQMPEKVQTFDLKKEIAKSYEKKVGSSITPSDYELDYKKAMRSFIKNTPEKEVSATELVRQYRKNNKSLGEYYEPGKSKAFNLAKKDALLDYNKIIAQIIEKKYPNSEFSKRFIETNKEWTSIMDAEAINKFVDDLFDGTINFNKADKFGSARNQESFKRSLGEDNLKSFESLLNDLKSSEKGFKMLKEADSAGYKGLASTAVAYVLHPKLAAAKLGYGLVKDIYKTLLDKPRLALIWDEGIKALEKGNYKRADATFKILDKELTPKQKAVKKFNEHKKSTAQTDTDPTGLASIGNMGKDMADNLYRQGFDSLKKGSTKIAGIEDPMLKAAKSLYDQGKIKTPQDLKDFANNVYLKQKK